MVDIRIPKQATNEFVELRKGIAACIKAVVPSDAVVYDNWALKYDLNETIELLSNDNIIHAWLVSVKAIDVERRRVGGALLSMPLTVRIWGFIGYSYSPNGDRQSMLEKECKDIIRVIELNQDHLGMDLDQFNPCIEQVGILTFPDIDVHAWGSASDVMVAQGTLLVDWAEHIQQE